jgi:hypothetical protein
VILLDYRLKSISGQLSLFAFLFILAIKGWALDGSIAMQGGYVQAIPSTGQNLTADSGINVCLYIDFNLLPSFALGLSTAYTQFEDGGQRLYVDGTLFNVRWSPWVNSSWSPYLTAGAGLRPLSDIDSEHRWWPGDFQTQAGIGVRHPIFNRVELDVTAFYNLNSPLNGPLSSVGVRAGLAFLIDFSSKKRPTSGILKTTNNGDSVSSK